MTPTRGPVAPVDDALVDLVRTYVRAEAAWRQCSGSDDEIAALDRVAVAAFDALNAHPATIAHAKGGA